MDVHTWCKKHVNSELEHFLAHCFSHFFHQIKVPRSRESCTYRECCSIIGVRVAFSSWVDADTGRTVSEDSLGDAKAWNCSCYAGCSRDKIGSSGRNSVNGNRSAASYEEGYLFFDGHRIDDLVDVVCSQLRLRESC